MRKQNYADFKDKAFLEIVEYTHTLKRFRLVLFWMFFCSSLITAQVTPPNADSDAECGADCYDLFNWSPVADGSGTNIPNYGEGIAEDSGCNTILDAAIEYVGNDSNGIDASGTAFGAGSQGNDPWTDEWTVSFGAELTAPVVNIIGLFSDSEVTFTDCSGVPISVTDISTGTVYAGGVFTGNDEVQISGTFDCIIITISNDRNDSYSISVGTCLSAAPFPPCVDCGANQDFEYINLTNRTGSGTGATADVELNNVLVGTAEVLFSNLSISEDLSGTAFGAFADGDASGEETMLLRIDFCEAISVQQLDVLGLETESQVWVGTSLSGSGATGIPGGLTLSQCGGSNTMMPVGNMVTNTNANCANQSNGNYTLGGLTVNTLYFRYNNPVGGCMFDKATFRIGTCVPDGADAVPTCPLTYVTYATDIEDYVTNGPDFIGADANAFQVMRDANGNLFNQDCSQIQNEVENMTAISTTTVSACAEIVDEVECNFCTPVPPCLDCPADTEYEYIQLTNATGSGTGTTADVELNNILVGSAEVLFSNLSVSEDLSGSAFGAFANGNTMEETMIMRIDFCDPQLIQQLDILGLETESQTWVGTSLAGMGMAGIPSGLTLTKCGGDADMIVSGGNMVVNEASSCANQGDANFSIGQTVSTLYFRYTNPAGGCRFDKATFRLGTCTADLVDAVPVCPLTVLSLTEDPDAYAADVAGGGTGDAFTFDVLRDANGNYFDRTCANIEASVTNLTAIPTVQISPCAEVVGESDCNFCEPVPPCVMCPADTNYDYINLTGFDNASQMGDVRLNGTVIGTSSLIFSDLDINTDFSGTRFGAFDNDGGVMVMQLDFCEPINIRLYNQA